MLNFQENKPFSELTTFKIGGSARYYTETSGTNDLVEELKESFDFAKAHNLPFMLVGDGSNMLVSDSGFAGVVLRLMHKGIEDLGDGRLKLQAGEFWDDVVEFAVQKKMWGIENLSHIPGRVGAFAVQNVGAYGQEASQVIEEVQVFDTSDSQTKILQNNQCGFSYRSSIFNSTEKGRYIILSVTIKLSLGPKPNIAYVDLQKAFADRKTEEITLQEIRDQIIKIRDRKFPYPYEPGAKGSAGSFFKNFLLSNDEYAELERQFEINLPEKLFDLRQIKNKFPQAGSIKIPTAFLLDCLGLKGLQSGGAKMNENQPLVILNETGKAKAEDVLNLAHQVSSTIKSKTGLQIKIEPELIGFSADVLQDF